MIRRYCWRVGCAWEQADGSKCEECGAPWGGHRDASAGVCGAYAPCHDCADVSDLHGHPCQRQPGHTGEHTARGERSLP